MIVETSPESLTTAPNDKFTVTCTARAEVDGQSVYTEMIIEWTRLNIFPPSSSLINASELMSTIITTNPTENGYTSILKSIENDSGNMFIYRCTARKKIKGIKLQ